MTVSKPISSPGQKMKTPNKGPLTPGLKSKTPVKGPQTPGQKTKTPNKGPQTPAHNVKSPGKGTRTPVQKVKTPGKGSQTPAQVKTPGKGPQTPAQKVKTPGKGPQTPAPKVKTPGKAQQTPAPNTETPGLKPKTPSKGPQTPAQKRKTPGKGPQTPAQKSPNANGTPKLKSPKVNGTPKPKTPNVKVTPKSKTPNVKGTPRSKTPNVKGTPKPKTPQAMEIELPVKSISNGTPKIMTPKASGTSKYKISIDVSLPESEVTMNQSFGSQMTTGQRKRTAGGEIVKQGKKKRAIVAVQEKKTEARHSQDLSSRSIRIYNLPLAVPQPLLLQKIKSLLAEQCTVEQIQMVPGRTSHIVVTFSSVEDAKTAKKFNGHVIEGRHLSITHKDDVLLPIEKRIVLSEVPPGLTDEDIWRRFGKCGKISSIYMMRQYKTSIVLKCFVAFENEKGAVAALAMKKPGMVVTRQNRDSRSYPHESTVYVKGFKKNTSEDDLKKFFSNAGPVACLTILGQTSALVEMTKVEDVESALALTGKKLSGNPITVMRHKLSSQNKKTKKEEVPSKKLKSDSGAVSMLLKEEDLDSSENTDGEDEDIDSSDDMETDSEINEELLTDFLGKINSLKANTFNAGEDDEDDSDEDDDDDDDVDSDEDEDSDEDGDENDVADEDGDEDDDEDVDEEDSEGAVEDDDDIDDDDDDIDNDDDIDDDDDDIDDDDD